MWAPSVVGDGGLSHGVPEWKLIDFEIWIEKFDTRRGLIGPDLSEARMGELLAPRGQLRRLC
jgi:hypothetical protein